MFDRVIRGGTIVDGTGAPPFTGDIAIAEGRIVELGRVRGAARETVNADGLLVTPGWVDIHSHYDGQATWDSQLAPSFWHGVTTTVMGNCGVGFAPVRADRRDWLIGLMEGVEDIPGSALADGIAWDWESFPEYLDALARRSFTMDVGAQVAHGPLRAYAMGDRAELNAPATEAEIGLMARLLAQAVAAGACGFSTSRTVVHRATDGEPVPGTFAEIDELRALARVLGAGGVMEVAPAGLLGEDLVSPSHELAWMNALSAETRCKVTFLFGQNHVQPEAWRPILEDCVRSRASGAMVVPQMFCRAIGIMVCLRSKAHPFVNAPSLRALSALPFAVQLRRLREDPMLRRQVALEGVDDVLGGGTGFAQWGGIYPLGEPGDYEPERHHSIKAIAERQGRSPREVALDVMLEGDGTGFLHRPVMNYANGDLEATRVLLGSATTVAGGGDGGAHVATICDAGAPTFLLTHWVRDRSRGARLPLEHIVRKQTFDTARLYGFADRGRLLPGLRADINLIDFDRLRAGPLHMVEDLPGGAQRLMQKAEGYVATFVAGITTQCAGEETGARPGRLLRGAGRAGQSQAARSASAEPLPA